MSTFDVYLWMKLDSIIGICVFVSTIAAIGFIIATILKVSSICEWDGEKWEGFGGDNVRRKKNFVIRLAKQVCCEIVKGSIKI